MFFFYPEKPFLNLSAIYSRKKLGIDAQPQSQFNIPVNRFPIPALSLEFFDATIQGLNFHDPGSQVKILGSPKIKAGIFSQNRYPQLV